MSLVLIPVRVLAVRANGDPVVGANVRAVLTVAESDDGIVVPDNIVGVTDGTGAVTLNLWPNSRGVNGSQYIVVIEGTDLYFSGLVTVPEAPSTSWPIELETLINQPPYPSLPAAQAAQQKALEYMTAAKGYRDEAQLVAAGARLFTTVALGITGTTSGQLFSVKQANGDAADVYMNSSGTAVKQTWTIPLANGMVIAQAVQLASASSIVGSFPLAPIVDVNTAAMFDQNGRCAPGAGISSTTVNRNLVAKSSGRILGDNRSGVTITEFYANGPQGKQTAKRLQIANSGTYDLWPGGVVLPAGPYTVKIRVKAAGGVDQAFNYGVAGGGGGVMTAGTALAAGWGAGPFTFTVSPNGTTDTPRVSITNTSGTAIDILIDEVQWYLSEETIPPFSTEVINQSNVKPDLAYVGSMLRDGNALDSRNGLNGFVKFSTYPLTKVFDPALGVTLMVLTKADDASIIASKLLSFDGTEATLGMGTQQGKAYAAPVLPRLTTNPAHYMAGQGYHVWTLRVKNGEQAFWIDKIKHTIGTTANPTIPTKTGLLVGGDEVIASSLQYKGRSTQIVAFDRWLTDAQVVQAYNVLVARHQIIGFLAPATDTVVFMEGDSIFENTSASPNGPNWAGQHALTNPAGLIYMNNAVSGSQLSHLTTRLASTDLTGRISVAVANGYKVIAVVLIGANGIPTIAALETYWQALKTAGAKVVACTVLPREDAGDGGAAFNAARAVLNPQILASAVPNAVADLAADPNIGVNGAPTAGVYYQADKTHPNAAGQAIMQTIILPKVNGLR